MIIRCVFMKTLGSNYIWLFTPIFAGHIYNYNKKSLFKKLKHNLIKKIADIYLNSCRTCTCFLVIIELFSVFVWQGDAGLCRTSLGLVWFCDSSAVTLTGSCSVTPTQPAELDLRDAVTPGIYTGTQTHETPNNANAHKTIPRSLISPINSLKCF